MTLEQMRSELARYGKLILDNKLATGAGGNISGRVENTMLISPSGLSLADATEEQFVAVDVPSGSILGANSLRPSSEVLMHLYCYRKRPEIRGIVHTHPQFTIALTSAGHTLRPMFADAIIYLGRRIPHIEYVTVTTRELAQAVVEVIEDSPSIVLRNHGAVTLGENVKEAFWRACTMEEAARIQLFATMVGTPRFLDDEEAQRLESLGSEKYRRELIRQMRDQV